MKTTRVLEGGTFDVGRDRDRVGHGAFSSWNPMEPARRPPSAASAVNHGRVRTMRNSNESS